MKASIITIGNELLGGFIIDSNASWMSRKLLDIGIRTSLKITVGDDKEEILKGLNIASKSTDLIFCTGGLGPTIDDVTLETFCEFIDANLEIDESYLEELKERFERRGREMPDSNRNQALIPNKGEVVTNPIGSARGVKYNENNKQYYVLPGVPAEMKEMMESFILPELKNNYKSDLKISTIRTTGIMESALHDKLSDLISDLKDVEIAFIPGFMGVDVRLVSEDTKRIEHLSDKIYDQMGNYIYGEDWESLEEIIGKQLREYGFTIATAESCTGGLMSDRITNIAGSSDYYLGGVVTYSNEAKTTLLGVRNETLISVGAVSEETAIEMAQGVRKLFQTDIGVSITGIAGPSGDTPNKPIGLTYIGLDFSGDIDVQKYIFSTDRRFNKELAAQAALNLVRIALL
ncbi:MAG: competence/damage-inducible protein A [Candidatus Marinimicrobia bacterium]|nr:competence/damage-inducible protein A [Candidatus Neomarinimicrobiota bacterium]